MHFYIMFFFIIFAMIFVMLFRLLLLLLDMLSQLRWNIRKIFGRTRSQTGGRIARATGGKIGGSVDTLLNKLMASAENAKKQSNSKTEDLLGVHDDHIAKALEVADRAI